MAAPRATQFLALRNLARQTNAPRQQIRNLHMTGPATYASPVLTQERSVLNLPRDIASLRAECKRRQIDASGSEQELISRLNAEHLASHRSFSTLSQTRPTTSSSSSMEQRTKRYFNTSRALKAVNDSSTIDFAYMPWSAADHDESAFTSSAAFSTSMPMPILPTNLSSSSPSSSKFKDAAPVMKPEISTMSADAHSTVSPLAESVDCHALHVDFQKVAEESVRGSVATTMRDSSMERGRSSEGAGVLRQIWRGVVDDLSSFGAAAGGERKMGFA